MIYADNMKASEIECVQDIYRIYEFADGLCFPEMSFRCGSIANYVKTGILSETEAKEIWNESDSQNLKEI